MSGTYSDRLRAVYASWAEGDLRAGQELFAPELRVVPLPDGGTPIIGRDAAAEYMRDFLAQWNRFRIVGEAFEELGNSVLVTEHQYATGKASGLEIDHNCYALWTFEDDLVVSVRWEMDRARLLEAAGLQE